MLQCKRQPRRDCSQKLIPDRMAQSVVDVLEPVEIEQQQRAIDPADVRRQPLVQRVAVR